LLIAFASAPARPADLIGYYMPAPDAAWIVSRSQFTSGNLLLPEIKPKS